MKDEVDTSVHAEIMRLHHFEGLSIRAIAKRLSISRKTVRLRLGRRQPAVNAKTGRRPSLLDGYEEMIQQWLFATPELQAMSVAGHANPRKSRPILAS